MTERFDRSFFARSAPDVARDLIGALLVADGPPRVVARLVETEAYLPDDPASHSFRGRTERNASMFGPAGHAYVYFIYGMHHCLNVVTGEVGEGSAVLLRAAEPLEGSDVMAARRGTSRAELLCAGPARLCQAFGIDRSSDGLDLVNSPSLHLAAGPSVPVEATPRIGVSGGRAQLWRFVEAGSPWMSRHSGQSRRSG